MNNTLQEYIHKAFRWYSELGYCSFTFGVAVYRMVCDNRASLDELGLGWLHARFEWVTDMDGGEYTNISDRAIVEILDIEELDQIVNDELEN